MSYISHNRLDLFRLNYVHKFNFFLKAGEGGVTYIFF